MKFAKWLPLALLIVGCDDRSEVPLKVTQENRTETGSLYTPSTQSLLRTHSWLEAVAEIDLKMGNEVTVKLKDGDKELEVRNIPANYLVPRLHYPPKSPPDEFDALNLMLAEYSRNGVSVPRGTDGDEMAHYITTLNESVPWKLKGDYKFAPNPEYCPLRFSVINNCLHPGLWELNATDRTGEIFHAWFDMPQEKYFRKVAKVNGVPKEFAKKSLQWNETERKLDLARLRDEVNVIGETQVKRVNEEASFSSQGSRRKLHKNYAKVEVSEGELRRPNSLDEMLKYPVHMSDFAPPGIYYDDKRKVFDYGFLADPSKVTVKHVKPKTSYRKGFKQDDELKGKYIELDIDLGDEMRIIVGNLPLWLLVEQQDFSLHGFGVGILPASDFAERRKFLLEEGPRPSFAYLVQKEGDTYRALNSHGKGIEQIFIRSYPNAPEPYWEFTITSFERIVDIVKYHITIPKGLQSEQKEHSGKYIPPLYFTYRDDNVN